MSLEREKAYMTLPQTTRYAHISLDNILSGPSLPPVIEGSVTGTRTHLTDQPYRYCSQEKLSHLADLLIAFTQKHAALYEADRQSLYTRFAIPKKTGGLRWINKPSEPMSLALIELRAIFEFALPYGYHTSAFAYVKGRQTLDALKKHKAAESKWFLKLDLHDFFDSTTKEFVLSMLSHIVPFNLICEEPTWKKALEDSIDLAFLNGGLPQGSELSPMLTNIIMIPFDFELTRALEKFGREVYTYTRYADDLVISCRTGFNPRVIKETIRNVFEILDAPYTFKEEKTKYGSSSGNNWMLGLILNKDNDITIGHKNKKQFRAMCCSFIGDCARNNPWPLEDVQHLAGLLSYYDNIEPQYFSSLISKINEKNHVDFRKMLRSALKGGLS